MPFILYCIDYQIYNNRAKTKKRVITFIIITLFAVRTGLEPATPCVTGTYSNQTELPNRSLYEGAKIQQISIQTAFFDYFFVFFIFYKKGGVEIHHFLDLSSLFLPTALSMITDWGGESNCSGFAKILFNKRREEA